MMILTTTSHMIMISKYCQNKINNDNDYLTSIFVLFSSWTEIEKNNLLTLKYEKLLNIQNFGINNLQYKFALNLD